MKNYKTFITAIVLISAMTFFQGCSRHYTNVYYKKSDSMSIKIEFDKNGIFYYYYYTDKQLPIFPQKQYYYKLHRYTANGRWTENSARILLNCRYFLTDPGHGEMEMAITQRPSKHIERATIYLQKKGKNKLDLNGITLKRQRIKSDLEYKIKRQFTQIKRKLRYLFSYYPAPQEMDAAHYLSLEYDTCHPLDRDTNYIYNVTELRHTSLHSAMDLLKSSPDADPADASRIRRRDADGCGTQSSNLTLETMDAIENSSQGYSLPQVEGDIDNPTLVDIVDEAYAYKAQYTYDATSMNGINPKKKTSSIHDINCTWVNGIKSSEDYFTSKTSVQSTLLLYVCILPSGPIAGSAALCICKITKKNPN